MAAPDVPEDLHLANRLTAVESQHRHLDSLLALVQEKGVQLPRKEELGLVRRRLEGAAGKRLDPLRDRLQALHADTYSPIAERWAELDDISESLDRLAADLLPVAHGALARAVGIEQGVCALAEELVNALASLTAGGERVVIPAARDHTSSGMWVISLALRHEGVWSLPIVAHELSHVVAADLKDQFGQELARSLLNGSWRGEPDLPSEARSHPGPLPYSRANELFADIFAAYCVGPAYAAALMGRCVPLDVWRMEGDHPPPGARLRAAIRAVEDTPAEWVSEMIEDDWEMAQAAAGGIAEPPPHFAAAVDVFTECALKVMELCASRARFVGTEVLAVGRQLKAGQPPAANSDLRTVINAAWAERVRNPATSPKIETALQTWMNTRPPSLGAGA